MNGMSPTTMACSAPRATAFTWWSISSIVTGSSFGVAEDVAAQGVADQQDGHPGSVEDLGGGEVVRGEHHPARLPHPSTL